MERIENLGKHGRPQPYEILPMSTDLAYVIGVYMGDGYCYKGSRAYKTVLAVADQDFAQAFASAIERLGMHTTLNWSDAPSRRRNFLNAQPIIQVVVCNKSLFMTLTRLTNNKKRIPRSIQEADLLVRIRFLEGWFDSDAMVKETGDLRIWIRLVGGRKVRTLMRFIQRCGIRVGKWGRRELPSGETYHGFHLSAIDFMRRGGNFHIAHKQRRLLSVLTD